MISEKTESSKSSKTPLLLSKSESKPSSASASFAELNLIASPKSPQAIKKNEERERLTKKISERMVENDISAASRGLSSRSQSGTSANKVLSELKALVIKQQIEDGFDVTDSTKEPSKKEIFEHRLQEKTIEIAVHYNNLSIEALTNFFADLLSLLSLCYLFVVLDIQITVTKSFLLEVFFGLDDTRKSLFILLITDLLVGYHSSNLWELLFEFLFNHYGLPESQTSIFLLVATLPVLLDVLFKYIIFRHLNRSSPATVATYHAMIE